MSHGLQIFDESGKVFLDSTTQTTSILGYIDVLEPKTFTIRDDRFNLGTPFHLASEFYVGVAVTSSFSNNTFTINVKRLEVGSFKPFQIIYGVY